MLSNLDDTAAKQKTSVQDHKKVDSFSQVILETLVTFYSCSIATKTRCFLRISEHVLKETFGDFQGDYVVTQTRFLEGEDLFFFF